MAPAAVGAPDGLAGAAVFRVGSDLLRGRPEAGWVPGVMQGGHG